MGRGMSAIELISRLQSTGIKLQARGNKLRYYPRGAVSPALLLQLVQMKEEILSYLSPDFLHERETGTSLPGLQNQRCFHCSGSGQCFLACCSPPPMFDSPRRFLCRACQGHRYLKFLYVH